MILGAKGGSSEPPELPPGSAPAYNIIIDIKLYNYISGLEALKSTHIYTMLCVYASSVLT